MESTVVVDVEKIQFTERDTPENLRLRERSPVQKIFKSESSSLSSVVAATLEKSVERLTVEKPGKFNKSVT